MNYKLDDFFSFRKMITLPLIASLYGFLFLLLTVGGVITMAQKNQLFQGLLVIIVGNIALRLIFEGMIVIFSMHNTLIMIEKKLGTIKNNK